MHAKVAALFLRGVLLREAVDLIVSLYQMVLETNRDELEGLVEFVRVAITHDDNVPTRSILHTEWVRHDPTETEELEDWYISLVHMYAPRFQLPPLVAPPPPLAPALAEPCIAPGVGAPPGGEAGKQNGEVQLKRPYTQNELAFLCHLAGEDLICGLDATFLAGV